MYELVAIAAGMLVGLLGYSMATLVLKIATVALGRPLLIFGHIC